MIAQGTQKLNLQNDILTEGFLIKKAIMPNVDHKTIVNHINDSNTSLVGLYKKQIKNTMGDQTSSNIMKIKNILYPTKIFNYQSVLNLENFTTQQYRKLSIMNIIQDIILNQVSKLIQVQNQIDVFTKKLIQISPGKTIIQYINQFILLMTHQAMFNSLYGAFKDSVLQDQRNKQMLRPILIKVKQVLQTVRFQLNDNQIMESLFDENIQPIISNHQQIKQAQIQQIQQLRKRNGLLFPNKRYGTNFRKYLLTMISKKKEKKIQQTFFSSKQPVIYSQLVKDALKDQITYVQKIIKEDI